MPVVRHLEALVRRGCGVGARSVRGCVTIHHRARYKRPDEVAETIGDEVDESLCGRTNLLTSALIGVDLPADEEEIVADPVQENADVDEVHHRPNRPGAECEISQGPGQHAYWHDDLDAELPQHQRKEQHEEDLGHLPKGLNERWVGSPYLVQKRIRERVVELQRDAEQKR